MPKKKKTLKQKIQSDSRKQASHSIPQSHSINVSSSIKDTISIPATPVYHSPTHTSVVTTDYRYLPKDLRKTAILTISIVVIEILMKLLHI